MIFDLPTTLTVGGREWSIETDFRQVLRVVTAFEDVDLTDADKAMLCLYDLYADLENMPPDLYQEAFDAAVRFIDGGGDAPNDDKPSHPRTMDWTQDAPLIFPAINKAAGFEVRSVPYMHWWTFLGYFMEIGGSVYATVLELRGKRARGKKLEKSEQEYWKQNKDICELKRRETAEERAEREYYERLLGG